MSRYLSPQKPRRRAGNSRSSKPKMPKTAGWYGKFPEQTGQNAENRRLVREIPGADRPKCQKPPAGAGNSRSSKPKMPKTAGWYGKFPEQQAKSKENPDQPRARKARPGAKRHPARHKRKPRTTSFRSPWRDTVQGSGRCGSGNRGRNAGHHHSRTTYTKSQ